MVNIMHQEVGWCLLVCLSFTERHVEKVSHYSFATLVFIRDSVVTGSSFTVSAFRKTWICKTRKNLGKASVTSGYIICMITCLQTNIHWITGSCSCNNLMTFTMTCMICGENHCHEKLTSFFVKVIEKENILKLFYSRINIWIKYSMIFCEKHCHDRN